MCSKEHHRTEILLCREEQVPLMRGDFVFPQSPWHSKNPVSREVLEALMRNEV